MAREPEHPRAEPGLWPLLATGGILAMQVVLLQVAVNRLAWGEYRGVFAPVVAVAVLAVCTWLLYRQIDRETM